MPAEPPLVSIVIPTRNRRELLAQTLASVRAQTCERWEAIVVDDGSTDHTAALVQSESKADPRIRLCQQMSCDRGAVLFPRENGPLPHGRGSFSTGSGANLCRNLGAAAARGEYIIFLDSDDLLMPTCLADRLAIIRGRPDLDAAVFSSVIFRNRPGDTPLLYNEPTGEDPLTRFLRLDVPWQTAGPIWRRSALQKIGRWDESLPSWQDWEFHIRALARGVRFEHLRQADSFYRMPQDNPQSITQHANAPDHRAARARLLRQVRALLTASGQLTAPRCAALAGRFLGEAERRMRCGGSLTAALATWRGARGLMSWRLHLEGAAYLAAHRLGRGKGFLRRRAKKHWPVNMLPDRGASRLFCVPYAAARAA